MLSRHSLLVLLALFPSCGGQNNIADCDKGKPGVPCSKISNREQAQQDLDEGDFVTAVTLLNELVADSPGDYALRTLLAAAYAGKAGPISIKLEQHRSRFRLIVADRGLGGHVPGKGFGTRMINAMVERLVGTTEYSDNEPGLRVIVDAPIGETLT